MSPLRVVPQGVFPFGTHVYREPHGDLNAIESDLAVLARLGFNMVKIQESWSADESKPGDVHLESIERLIATAGSMGLGIYLGVTMEQVPAWAWQRYPDAAMVDSQGRANLDRTQYCLPADAKPGPCWDHPGMREVAEGFLRVLASRLGKYENLWVWNTWQEIGFWPNDAGALGYCYCPHTLESFRAWLRQRYDSLQALNLRWASCYGDWAEVEPPRRYSAVPSFIDWRYFMDDVYLPRVLAWKTRALRDGDPFDRPVFSHVASPTVGSSAHWRWAAAGDFFGTSNYPAWRPIDEWDEGGAATLPTKELTLTSEMWNSLFLNNDLVRSALGREKSLWGAEFQGGPISTHLHCGRVPTTEDIHRWVLTGLAAGMNGISFWNHRSEVLWQEAHGFGLLDRVGAETDRAREAGRLARKIQRDAELFTLGVVPRPQVGILLDEALFHYCQGSGREVVRLLEYSVRGHYARLWRLGVSVEFIDSREALEGALSTYDAVIAPMPIAMSDGLASTLHDYVKAGGTLISDACPGRVDDYGHAAPTQMYKGSEELFGARHHELHLVAEPDDVRRWTPQARGFGEIEPAIMLRGTGLAEGCSLRACYWLQTLEVTKGDAILHAGERVAGVRREWGSGAALLIGTFAGLGATAYRGDGDRLYGQLLQAAGIRAERAGNLLLRRRRHQRREAWFLLNPTGADQSAELSFEGVELVRDLDDEVDVRMPHEGVIDIKVRAHDVRCLIVERIVADRDGSTTSETLGLT